MNLTFHLRSIITAKINVATAPEIFLNTATTPSTHDIVSQRGSISSLPKPLVMLGRITRLNTEPLKPLLDLVFAQRTRRLVFLTPLLC
jgi:hypothetical protein